MEFRSNDDALVESLALQIAALQYALSLVISENPRLQGAALALAANLPTLLMPSPFSDRQIEAIAQLLRGLADAPG